MSMDSVIEEKRRLRRQCLEFRRSLSEEQRCELNEALLRRFLSLPEFHSAGGLLLYASMPEEPATLPIARLALEAGKRVAFPICLTESTSLAFYEVGAIQELSPGHYGILEPPSVRPANPAVFPMCIVPAAAFDREGHRIGLGKGYYDRFLADYQGFTVGLVYSGCLLPRVPRESHDMCVDAVITEQEIVRPSAR